MLVCPLTMHLISASCQHRCNSGRCGFASMYATWVNPARPSSYCCRRSAYRHVVYVRNCLQNNIWDRKNVLPEETGVSLAPICRQAPALRVERSSYFKRTRQRKRSKVRAPEEGRKKAHPRAQAQRNAVHAHFAWKHRWPHRHPRGAYQPQGGHRTKTV